MKNKKMHLTAKAMLICSIGMLPLLAAAQKDSTKHKGALGIELNTIGNYYFNNGYGYPFYYQYPFAGNNGTTSTTTNGSFSVGLRFNHYFNNSLSLKIKLGIRNYSNTYSENVNPLYSPTNNFTEKQMALYFVAGCQQSFHVNKFTDFNAGLDFSFIYNSTLTENGTEEYVNSYGTITNYMDNYTSPGGVIVGIGPVVGLTFKPGKHIGIGADITDALEYQYLGGKETGLGSGSSYSATYILKGFTDSGIIASIYFSYLF